MKKQIEKKKKKLNEEKRKFYLPFRYLLVVLISALEILAIIGGVVALCIYFPHFVILAYLIQIGCVLKIVASNDNPDYKVPWLITVIVLPVIGFMLYILFYSRKLKKKYIRRLNDLKFLSYNYDDGLVKKGLEKENPLVFNYADMICKIADTNVFTATRQTFFGKGEEMFESIISDLAFAKKFIYLEYFIIEKGKMWNAILQVLRQKADEGLDVKVVFDDVGCMCKLPSNYCKKLKSYGINATVFSRLKGHADSEFNNRNHRKFLIIDGNIGYTGGLNIADEYINKRERFGYWKDGGIRLEGNAVWEMTELFVTDYFVNVKDIPSSNVELYPKCEVAAGGYVIPFGDGPKPLYTRNVGKSVIMNMLNVATRYAYITTPYLVIDNELCSCIENTALKGVDVRIVLPGIPDKKTVFEISRSYYSRLMQAGVKIYEYTPGFIHSKTYLIDGECALVGSINLDYRSLVHHFENGVWMYKTDCISEIDRQLKNTIKQCKKIEREDLNCSLFKKIKRSVVRIFAPLL